MKNFIYLSLFFSFSSLGQESSASGFDKLANGRNHIILIGVSDYTKFPKLDFADDDALLMESYFKGWKNTNIKTFINGSALKKDSIGQEIHNTLINEANKGDRVILFFSGHGDVDPKYNDGYLILGNAEPPSAKTYKFNSALSMKELEEMMNLAATNGVQVTLITDACKSGSAITNSGDANQRMLEIGQNSLSIVSCGPTESSFESKDLQNGIFTFYLVQGMMGLADSNNDQIVSNKELRNYLEENVDAESKKINPSYQQNPNMKTGVPADKFTTVTSESLAIAKEKADLVEKKQFNKIKSFDDYSENVYAKLGKGNDEQKRISSSSSYLIYLMRDLIQKEVIFKDEISASSEKSLVKGSSSYQNISSNPIASLSISSDGNYIASPANSDVSILNHELNQIKKLKGHKGGVTVVEFRPGTNHVLSGSWDNSVILWDVESGSKIASLDKLSDDPFGLCFINVNEALIGTNKGDLYHWNITTGASKKVKIASQQISAIEIMNETVVVGSLDGNIRFLDINSLKEKSTVSAHKGGTKGLKFNPLTQILWSVGEDKVLKGWSASSLNEVKSYRLDFHDNRDIDIDPFGSYAFISSRRYDLDIVDLKNGEILEHYFSSQSSGLSSVAFDPVSSSVLMGDVKGRIHRNELNINRSEFAAIDIYELLLKSSDAENFKYRFDGTLLIGLNTYISKILNPLVNGDAVLPTIEEIRKAKKYSAKALEVGQELAFEKKRAEIDHKLLEIFEILATNNADSYAYALTNIQRIESLDPNGAYAMNISGALLARLDKLQEAKSKAGKAEELAPLWAEAPCGTGKILFQEKNYLGAEEKFKETISKGPELSKGYYNLAHLYNTIGRIDEAEKMIDLALKIDSDVLNINRIAVQNSFLKGDYSAARRTSSKVSIESSAEMKVYNTDARVLDAKGSLSYENLLNDYKTAYNLDSTNQVVVNGLAYFYLRLLNDDKAAKFVESNFSAKEGDRTIKGNTLLKRECKRIFNYAEKLNKYDVNATIGDWMTRGSEVQTDAINSFLTKHKNSAEAYAGVGRYFIHQKDYKSALKYLKLGLKEDANHMKCIVLHLEANKLSGKEKKNATLVTAIQKGNTDVLKYRSELTKYYLLY